MVKFIGKINRVEVNKLFGSSRAGLLVYQPARNHMEAMPNKLFEFMAAGLPVIASDFPLWKSIIDEAQCGLTVDPNDVDAVRKACEKLLNDTDSGQQMGRNGRKKIVESFNWDIESKKLLDLYANI